MTKTTILLSLALISGTAFASGDSDNTTTGVTCLEDVDNDGLPSGYLVESADNDCDDPGEVVDLGQELDCDDTDPNLGAFEIVGDGLDNNCNGLVDTFIDDDGDDHSPDGYYYVYGDREVWVEADCDDAEPSVHGGKLEELTDGLDNDCDGLVDIVEDLDNDGYSTGGHKVNGETIEPDCDDDRAYIHPGAEELNDLIDYDCDGQAADQNVGCGVQNGDVIKIQKRWNEGYFQIEREWEGDVPLTDWDSSSTFIVSDAQGSGPGASFKLLNAEDPNRSLYTYVFMTNDDRFYDAVDFLEGRESDVCGGGSIGCGNKWNFIEVNAYGVCALRHIASDDIWEYDYGYGMEVDGAVWNGIQSDEQLYIKHVGETEEVDWDEFPDLELPF